MVTEDQIDAEVRRAVTVIQAWCKKHDELPIEDLLRELIRIGWTPPRRD